MLSNEEERRIDAASLSGKGCKMVEDFVVGCRGCEDLLDPFVAEDQRRAAADDG